MLELPLDDTFKNSEASPQKKIEIEIENAELVESNDLDALGEFIPTGQEYEIVNNFLPDFEENEIKEERKKTMKDSLCKLIR